MEQPPRDRPLHRADQPAARALAAALGLLCAALLGPAQSSCRVKVPPSHEDGNGEGIPCEDVSECPFPKTPCLLAMCLEGQCVHVPGPDGTLPDEDQVTGDCQQLYCDGNGQVISYPNQFDAPPDDGNPCTQGICDAQQAVQRPLPASTPCGEGKICTGKGICGICLPDKQRCEQHAVTTCTALGQWSEPAACPVGKPVCHEAVCTGVVEIAAGSRHACARFDDGGVRCWGDSGHGQLGSGGLSGARRPAWAGGFSVTAFGPRHACGLRTGGAVWCWGANDFGQLGEGSYVSSNGPSPVTGLSGAVEVAVGTSHSCARRQSGEIHCWGRNDRGQLGTGKKPNGPALPLLPRPGGAAPQPQPVAVAGLSGVEGLLADEHHSCVQLASGALSCWGLLAFFLPDAIEPPEPDPGAPPAATPAADPVAERSKIASNQPLPVTLPATAGGIAAGADHSCALLSDGTVCCWGANDQGQLGDGTTQDQLAPVKLPGLTNVARIALGDDFGCALHRDQTVSCWGANTRGQLGTGKSEAFSQPAPLAGLSKVKTLQVGAEFACAQVVDGQLLCWGDNSASQLGNGTTTNATQPVVVSW